MVVNVNGCNRQVDVVLTFFNPYNFEYSHNLGIYDEKRSKHRYI